MPYKITFSIVLQLIIEEPITLKFFCKLHEQ